MPNDLIHYKYADGIPFCELPHSYYPSVNGSMKGKLNKIENPIFPDEFCDECFDKLIELNVIDDTP